eukprot:13971722-Alexandrium_andersonii.AAC.1
MLHGRPPVAWAPVTWARWAGSSPRGERPRRAVAGMGAAPRRVAVGLTHRMLMSVTGRTMLEP